jgi:hypothetical protein
MAHLQRVHRLRPARLQHVRAPQHRLDVARRLECATAERRIQRVQLVALDRFRARTADAGRLHFRVERLETRDQPELLVPRRQVRHPRLQRLHATAEALQLLDQAAILLRQPVRLDVRALLHEEAGREEKQQHHQARNRRECTPRNDLRNTHLPNGFLPVRDDQQGPASLCHIRIRSREAPTLGSPRVLRRLLEGDATSETGRQV